MCGIGGVFSSRPASDAVEMMMHCLRHRGPDDAGAADLQSDSGRYAGCFGHRRLAIIDLSPAGHQPMFSPSGRSCITYNGEIYNFEELRRELALEGSEFNSHCDTEVVLVGYEKYGVSFLSRLRGMFAFALWDRVSDRGYLARDRFGIKPLYVAEVGGDVLFASEVRALLSTNCVPRILSAEAVESYLATGSVAAPNTIIQDVYSIAPGTAVEVVREESGFRLGKRVTFAAPFTPSGQRQTVHLKSHVHRIRNALRESVGYHLVSDVPVAVFLSGGIDSSAIAGLASEVSEKPLETFTVTFSEASYSEATPARDTAKRFGTIHHEIPVSAAELLKDFPEAFAAMDQPSLDGMNTFVVSRAVRSHGLKVVLSGLGGDELFGGYPSFQRASMVQPLWKLPSLIRRLTAASARISDDPRAARIAQMLMDTSVARGAYRASRTLFSRDQIHRLLMESRNGKSGNHSDGEAFDPSTMSLMQAVSLYELTGYMRNTLLRDSDVFSMAHGLELRVPFVDEVVARVAQDAAADLGGVGDRVKPLLVEAVRDLLSEDNLSRRKMGFTLPFEAWMRNELYQEMVTVLGGDSARNVGLDPAVVGNVWQAFLEKRGGVNWSRPWALYTLIRWSEENDVAWPSSATFPLLDAVHAVH